MAERKEDDLRTRAREAAYEQCANDEQGDAFTEGALWHAAQQPSREDIAEALADAPDAFGTEAEDWLEEADTILALFDGADR